MVAAILCGECMKDLKEVFNERSLVNGSEKP